MVGAFSDKDRIVPVKMEVKTFTDTPQNTLHIAVTKGSVNEKRLVSKLQTPRERPSDQEAIPAFCTISIRQLVKNVNISDGDLLKYFPRQMLGIFNGQRRAADEARVHEQRYVQQKLVEHQKQQAKREKQALAEKNKPKVGTDAVRTPSVHGTDAVRTKIPPKAQSKGSYKGK
jgi:hypothetical protein